MKKFIAVVTLILVVTAFAAPAFASEMQPEDGVLLIAAEEEAAEEETAGESKAAPAAIAIAVVAAAGAIAMAIAIKSSSEGIARQPEAAGDIRTGTLLGLVFIETAIIYALIVAILIIFVL